MNSLFRLTLGLGITGALCFAYAASEASRSQQEIPITGRDSLGRQLKHVKAQRVMVLRDNMTTWDIYDEDSEFVEIFVVDSDWGMQTDGDETK